MSRLTVIFILAAATFICCIGQQYSVACVTPGFDEYVAKGCGDSGCSSGCISNVGPQTKRVDPPLSGTRGVLLAAGFWGLYDTSLVLSSQSQHFVATQENGGKANPNRTTIAFVRGGQK